MAGDPPAPARSSLGRRQVQGTLPKLETELCGLIEGGDYEPPWKGGEDRPAKSPDRANVMV